MRLIDANTLMKELEREVELADDWKTAHEIANCVKYAPTAVDWISVNDRLPDECKYVLVWESQGFAYCDKLIYGIWNIGANNGAIITHWMPLPEPPKEVSEDG